MGTAEGWSKATRLAVAGAVAPHLRNQTGPTSRRRVARVDKDGNVVGYTTLAEVQKALLARHRIEIEVTEDTRPREVFCEFCGKVVKVPDKGRVPTACLAAGGCYRQRTCAGHGDTSCKKKPGRQAFRVEKVRRRGGAPWRCCKCGVAQAAIDDPGYRERAAAARLERTKDPAWRAGQAEKQRRVMSDPEHVKRLKQTLKKTFTPERRARQAELARQAMADPERRARAVANLQRGSQKRTHEERSRTSKKAQAARSFEERSASSRKGKSRPSSERRSGGGA